VFNIFSVEIESGKMIANLFKSVPKETMRTGVYFALAGLGVVNVFPVLREWEVFSSFPSKAYMEKEVRECIVSTYVFVFRPL